MSFVQPPFWASEQSWRPAARHAVSVLVSLVAPGVEPLTLDQGKLRAGLDWPANDPRDALMLGFIQAARWKVELDTGLALPSQTRDLFFDAFPQGHWTPVQLPAQSTPLQSVTSITSWDTANVAHVLDPSNYQVDTASGRLSLSFTGVWPTDLRPMQPWVIRIVSGWASVDLMPPPLVHAVGLMTAHYATVGRDVAAVERVSGITVPYGYDDAIAPYRLESVA